MKLRLVNLFIVILLPVCIILQPQKNSIPDPSTQGNWNIGVSHFVACDSSRNEEKNSLCPNNGRTVELYIWFPTNYKKGSQIIYSIFATELYPTLKQKIQMTFPGNKFAFSNENDKIPLSKTKDGWPLIISTPGLGGTGQGFFAKNEIIMRIES